MSPTHSKARLVDVAEKIGDGDLLLFRGRGLFSRIIKIGGRSEYSHAAMTGWCRGMLMCLEMRERAGGRCVTLESQVKRLPGQIDVYTVRAEFAKLYSGFDAATEMLRKCGREYGATSLIAAAFSHLAIARLFHTPATVDDVKREDLPEFCSQAVSTAAQFGGGFDPCPNAAGRMTEPGDLARSNLWQYRWTLEGL